MSSIKLESRSYVYEDVIGEGRFAKVYKGHCIHKTEEKVAIRKLKATENAAFNEKKFLKEAEELVKFKHSNIVKTFGVLIDEKAFVQEYCVKVVQGNEIHSLLGLINKLNEDFPLEVKLTCFLNITKALSYLHINNIVVGDLKPANVLVTSSAEDEWIFKLADIAPETRKRNDCSAAMSSCISEKNNFVFTAAYLAPELLKFNSNMNENKTVTCDIYSFAMMIYQVLFPNVPLYEEINPIHFIIAVTNKWRRIPRVNNSVYKRLVHVMEICWHNDLLKRPKSDSLWKLFQEIDVNGCSETFLFFCFFLLYVCFLYPVANLNILS